VDFVRKFFLLLSGIFFCLVMVSPVWAAPPEKSQLEQAQLEMFCAWTDLASYDDSMGLLARSQLAASGWEVQGFNEVTAAADARFYAISRLSPSTGKKIYILAITGTETQKDIQVDLKLGKVYFGGTSRQEFAEAAQRQNLTAVDPMVHKGFDDYTRTAFFTREYDGGTFGEHVRDLLLAAPDSKLYITGHSLGGAVATLFSARLAAMGVPEKQLEVISFGAPAVGNAAFARVYGDKMQLDRVVIEGDLVKSLLQSLPNGYAQFGNKNEWRRNRNSERFHHDMVLYADAAVRNFYDLQQSLRASRADTPLFRDLSVMQAAVYVAPCRFALDDKIAGDEPYMKHVLQDRLADRIQGVVFDSSGTKTLTKLCALARAAGCKYVLIDRVYGERIRDVPYSFRMSLEEELYNTDGKMLFVQSSTTNTDNMTPLGALFYVQASVQQGREQALLSDKKEEGASR
jgi:hypothetical protein